MNRCLWCVVLFLIAACFGTARADTFRPAYFELRQIDAERYDVLWKVPALDRGTPMAMHVRFPDGTRVEAAPRTAFTGDAIVEQWRVHRSGGMVGQAIRFEGRATGATDIIARVEWADGASQVERLPPVRTSFIVEAPASTGQIAWSYLVLGVEHILGGIDHLLFVLALLLVVRGGVRIVATVTAFTAAHSLTLVAATLGWVHVPGAPVEATIALSIVFVSAQVIRGMHGKPGLTARAPWVVAFAFGLLHGFGFAGALADVGLPQKAIPIALLTFNVGVELGQLVFVCGALAVVAATKRWIPRLPQWSHYAPAYAIGGAAAFWTIQRTVSIWA
ncbi:HupE/UreJ family protein [Noviluteimonas gilva]|uniref:HupE/UreJ family protein n=1 Tax=Noviluteimonas gilva TaxID=2682097 RepID=A0A7C9HP65_9GAMM|nr:HupE/UreJ family protein [Lysobacter gilvus]MUV15732.1 HupE/UreJ family protein [Lysobacter gilvus]